MTLAGAYAKRRNGANCLNQNLQNYGIYRISTYTDLFMEKDELTFKIIGCAMKVHNTLGNGFTHGEFIL